MSEAQPRAVSVRLSDIEQARTVGSSLLHPHSLTSLGRARGFDLALDVARIGPVSLGWLRYGQPVRIESSHPAHYQINIPTGGACLTVGERDETQVEAGAAALFAPDRATHFTVSGDFEALLAVRIPRAVLRTHLEGALGRPVPEDFRVDAGLLDLRGGPARDWAQLVQALAGGLPESPNALIYQPLVASPFIHTVVNGLLFVAEHDYREELEQPSASAGTTTIRRATAYIERNATQPITVDDIAGHVGLSVRALQQAFAGQAGTTPTRVLRTVRLRGIRRELMNGRTPAGGVGEVAARWGMPHRGRMAAAYLAEFGESPAQTLRNGSSARGPLPVGGPSKTESP